MTFIFYVLMCMHTHTCTCLGISVCSLCVDGSVTHCCHNLPDIQGNRMGLLFGHCSGFVGCYHPVLFIKILF